MPVKSDRIDARNIAWALQAGWYREVHVKSRDTHRIRAVLRSRELLVNALDNHLRGILKAFGLKIGKVAPSRFEARVLELVGDDPVLRAAVDAILQTRREVMDRLAVLHRLVLNTVKVDPVCQRLMTVPDVGPITSLAYRTAVEDPARFRKSALVGAHFGLTPREYASGEIDRNGNITKCGDRMVRTLLTRRRRGAGLRNERRTTQRDPLRRMRPAGRGPDDIAEPSAPAPAMAEARTFRD